MQENIFGLHFYAIFIMYLGGFGFRCCIYYTLRQYSKSIDGETYHFDNALCLGFVICIGRALCNSYFFVLLIHLKIKKIKRLNNSDEAVGHVHQLTAGNVKFSPFFFILPALFEFISLLCYFVGLSVTKMETVTAIEGFSVILIPLTSRVCMQNKYPQNVWPGVILVYMGYIMIGIGVSLSSMEDADESRSNATKKYITVYHKYDYSQMGLITGLVSLSVAVICIVIYALLIEMYTKKEDIPPMLANLWIGFFGIIISSLSLIPAYYIQIPTYKANPENRFEYIKSVSAKIMNNPTIGYLLFGVALNWGFFTIGSLIITKDFSASASQVIYYSSGALVFFVELIRDKSPKKETQWIQGTGLGALSIGTMIYFDVILKPVLTWVLIRCHHRNADENEDAKVVELQSLSSDSDEKLFIDEKNDENVLSLEKLSRLQNKLEL